MDQILLYTFLQENNIIYRSQYGFKKINQPFTHKLKVLKR